MEVALLVINTLVLVAVAAQAFFVSRQVVEMRRQFEVQGAVSAKQFAGQIERLDRQIDESTRARLEDHDRRKKQATIEIWAGLQEHRSELQSLIRDAFGTEPLTNKAIAEWVEKREAGDVDANRAIRALVRYLDALEHFATGVNSDVFDLHTANAMCGGSFVRVFPRYGAWIARQRSELSRPTLYSELEELASEITALRSPGTRTIAVGN